MVRGREFLEGLFGGGGKRRKDVRGAGVKRMIAEGSGGNAKSERER